MNYNNEYILYLIEEEKNDKQNKIIEELRKLNTTLNDNKLLELYNKSISIHQSKNQGNGSFLEKTLIKMLEDANIPYRTQVTINSSGLITGFNIKKRKCYHIVDFVCGENIDIGKSITDYKVISCKTTCRERWTQDDWTYTFVPMLYILLTTSNDYPTRERFRENKHRKIVTCLEKKKDDRLFQLRFEDLINELT